MKSSHFLLATLALAPSLVKAQAQAPAPAFGFQTSLLIPQGNLGKGSFLDDRIGAGLGVHLDLTLGAKHSLRPRLDLLLFQEHTWSTTYTYGADSAFAENRFAFRGLSLGVDYLYWTRGRGKGLHLLGGLALARWDSRIRERHVPVGGSGLATARYDQEEATLRPAFSAGFGYQFNTSWGLEARYSTSRWSSSLAKLNADIASLGVTYRF